MDTGEYLKRYFEYLKDKPITAANIRNATASAHMGELPAPALEMILAQAAVHGVNPEKELAELHAAREAAKAETAEKNRRANLKASIEKIKSELDELSGAVDTAAMGDLSEALSALNADTAGLVTGAASVNRFPTWADYEAAYQKESDDFSPPMFGNLGFPEGSISYIGARTGRGKTTAMVCIGIEALFARFPRRVLFITLEENQKQILRRFSLCLAYRDNPDSRDALLSVTNYYSQKRDPKGTYKYWKQGKEVYDGPGVKEFISAITEADKKIRGEVEAGNFIFFDGIGARLYEILAAIRERRRGDIVLLDYIQKIPAAHESRGGNPDLERIRDGSQRLIEAAKSRECIIISGAQFNRDSQRGSPRGNDEFTDADFRGCGDLEQDGHNLIGIGRTADKKTHYYSVIKSREAEITGELYTLHFAGGYSYMAPDGGTYEKPKQNNKGTSPAAAGGKKEPENSGALGEKEKSAADVWASDTGEEEDDE
jgi:hypothetical protein